MKKLLPILTIFVFVLTAYFCGGDSPEKITAEFADAYMDQINEVSEARDAEGVAKALNNFADKIEKMSPRIEKLKETNPDYKFNPDKMSNNMKSDEKNAQEMMGKMMSYGAKIEQYKDDAKVKAALERLEKFNDF